MTLPGARFEVFFRPRANGQRFCVLHLPSPAIATRGALLFVHPFAEEMNKARRAVAIAARRFAQDGWFVLLTDLFGCGDSAGDFGDSSWRQWVDDVVNAALWLQDRTGLAPVLWGLRTGCLLLPEALKALRSSPHLVLWHPVATGSVQLNQFLRLKAAAQLLDETGPRINTQALRNRWVEGETVEIAGYAVSPELALPLESAQLELPEGYPGRVLWCEVTATADPLSLAPASVHRIDRWRQRGVAVEATAVGGLPFWQTQEIADCPPLVEVTRQFLQRCPA